MSIPTNADGDNDETQSQYSAQRSKRRRTESYGLTQEIGLMRDGGEPGLPRFIGSGSGIHFIRTVYDALARSAGGSAQTKTSMTSQIVPGEDDQLINPASPFSTPGTRARAHFWHQDEIMQDAEMQPRSFRFEHLVDCTKSYFENWHPAFPFLHGPEILVLFEQVGSHGISSLSEADATIVRAIVSISLADSRQFSKRKDAIPAELVFLSQEDIASRLVFAVGCPASLKNLQAAVGVMLFLISMLKFNMASRLSGIVVRMALHLGLHRCPYRYPNFSSHEASMRKRLWWSLYCLDRMVCQSLGTPLDIRDDDVDVCYTDTERHDTSSTEDRSEYRQLQLLALLSKHARLRGMILELRNKALQVRHDSLEHSLIVQAQLAKWINDVHDTAESDDGHDTDGALVGNEEPPYSECHKILLEILQHESVITLNRPLLASNPATPASQAALQACISASKSIVDKIRDAHTPRSRNELDDSQSRNNITVWPLSTWSVWMSCFILAYAALEGVITVLSAQRYTRKALHILKHLACRGTSWPNSCINACEQILAALDKERDRNFRSSVVSPRTGNQRPQSSLSSRRHEMTMPQIRNATTNTLGFNGEASESTRGQTALDSRYHYTPSNESREAQNHIQYTPINQTQPQATFETPFSHPHSVEVPELQEQWLDPLNALDFSNFAQAGTADSAIGFGFY